MKEEGKKRGSPCSWGAVGCGILAGVFWLLWAWLVWGETGFVLRRSGQAGEVLETLSVLGPLGFGIVAMPLGVMAGRRKEPRESLGNAGAVLGAVCALVEMLYYFAVSTFAPR